MTAHQSQVHNSPEQISDIAIPESLIYEMVDGTPIYYRGWQEVLRGEKTIEQVMASSLIQSYLVHEIDYAVHVLRKKFIIGSNEAGLKFQKGDWRAADIALWTKESMKDKKLDDHYIEVVPDIVIEVDTKADTAELPTYYLDKTKQLHQKGVRRVLWIFTKTEQVMIAENGQKWEIQDWSESFEVSDGCILNVKQMIDDFQD